MKAAVVTGADGFIGSHLLKRLSENQIEIWALVMINSPTLSRIRETPNVHIIECDFSSLNEYQKDMPEIPDAFYHLAWQGVAPKERNSLETQSTNIDISLDALRLAKSCKAKRFILPGSTTEYMYSKGLVNEFALPSPQNAYGAVKLATRYLCEELARELQQPYIYTVFTGVYGGDRTDNNVIFYTINSLLKGECPKLTALTQLWDYIHILDLTRALLCIGEKGKDGAFYTVGHGDNWPLFNYIYKIRDIIDPSLPLGIGKIPYSSNLIPSSCVDLTSLYEDTGFVPQIPFEEGIREVIDQVKKNYG